MSMNGGLGGITVKNIMLYNRVTEKVMAYKKSNSEEFWVISQKYNSDEFLAYEVSATGVNQTPVISSVTAFNGPERRQAGQIKISPNGKRLAIASGWEVQVFDFDENTANISNPITLLRNINNYGIEFSPNSKLLYTALYESLCQFDLSAGAEVDIENSKVVLKSSSGESFGSLQLGPDEKIYGVKVRGYYLDVIHNPDGAGLSCDYRYNDLYLDGAQGFLGLPTFISNIYTLKGNITSENFCHGDATGFSFDAGEPLTSISWDFGDGSTSTLENPTHTYASPGDYIVSITATTASASDTETKEITIYPNPIANTITDFEHCSTSPTHEFDLSTKNTEILNGQSVSDFSVDYYPTLSDAQNQTNVLPLLYTNTNAIETVFARIFNIKSPSCFDTTSFDVILKEAPVLNLVADWTVCDTDNDGFYDFDLSVMDSQILNGQSSSAFSVSYYTTQADADAATNAIGPTYQNTVSTERIFFRIENSLYPECYEIGIFNLEVITSVVANDPMAIEICDDDNDGFSVFDLSVKDNEILGLQNPANFSVSYHVSQIDADTGANPLESGAYRNTMPYNQNIFARVWNNGNSECYDTVSFSLRVFDSPIAQNVTDWQVCDDNNDGTYGFDLNEKNTGILGGQSEAGFRISYHLTQTDADSRQNAIIGNYQNTSNPERIFYRVENIGNVDCFLTDSFVLEVFDTPTASIPLPIVACDENESGTRTFDLSVKDTEVLNGQDPNIFTVSYFISQNDSENNRNPVEKQAYSNSHLQETIYARVQNKDIEDCFDTTEFEINIQPLPQPDLEETYVICPDSPELTIDGGDFESWSWYDGNTSEIGNTRYFNVSELGDYTLTVTQTSNGITCEKTIPFEVVSSGAPEDFTTEIDNPSDNVTIIVNTIGTGEFEYSTDGAKFQRSNRLEVFPGEHTVYVRDKFLCRTISKEVIALGYQKFFTPNNDGIHEHWNIIGADHYLESQLYIYDKYGKLLGQFSPTGPGWDGTYNGFRLPSSDYWFRYVFDNGKVFTGHFALKR